ncbi:hypothetical protein JXJ21_08310 [candidate division KSB1 bacterium]|nr:hypothetical protein [candidate division KSB1 bacterium]
MCKQFFRMLLVIPFFIVNLKADYIHPAQNHYATVRVEILEQLCDAITERQIKDEADQNFGAIMDSMSNEVHLRTGEAIFPLAAALKYIKRKEFGSAAIQLSNWVLSHQEDEGSWHEISETDQDITANLLLALACAYPIVEPQLSKTTMMNWQIAMRKAANFLARKNSNTPQHTMQCATIAAALAATWLILPDGAYKSKAIAMARLVGWSINKEGFISCYASHDKPQQLTIDPGRALDSTIWLLGFYAKVFKDDSIKQELLKALVTHLSLVYPNGSIDYSWGVCSNEWTTFGNINADGCQASFSLFADEDSRFYTAGILNLEYLSQFIENGLIAYGPLYRLLFDHSPSIRLSISRAKNLAFAIEYGAQQPQTAPALPCEIMNWHKYFKTTGIVLVRSPHYMATLSAFNAIYRGSDSGDDKALLPPAGGSLCNLWCEGSGFLQLSSQAQFHPNPSLFPELDYSPLPLTPRIETYSEKELFSNLHEYRCKMSVKRVKNAIAKIAVAGRLKNIEYKTMGIMYRWTHRFESKAIEKEVFIHYGNKKAGIQIIEPFVHLQGAKIHKLDDKTVRIAYPESQWILRLVEGKAKFELGKEAERYRLPVPGIRCYPVTLRLPKYKNEKITIVYRLEKQ